MKERSRRPGMQSESDIWDTFNKPLDKLSLGFEAAKYKASIKSSPVVSNNVYQSLLASEFHCPQQKTNIVIMDMTILITKKIFLSKYCTFFLLHYDLKGCVEYGP